MIKPNELRVGNLVKQGFVESIPCNVGDCDADVIINGDGFSFEEVEPIPLTEEWLIRFGFEPTSNDYYQLGNYKITDNMEFMFFDIGDHYMKINSVNQLQNLFYSLTNTELKLEQ